MDANKTNHFYIINSNDRLSSESDINFTCKPHRFNHTSAFGIKEVLIPHTFYNVNSNNNTLIIRKNGDTQDRNVTVTPGNYNLTNFIVALKAAMDASGGPAQTYTITSSDITAKITIAQNNSSFIIRKESSIYYLLGSSNLVDTSDSISHTMVNVYDLGYTNYVKIYSTQLTKYNTRVVSSGNDSNSLLCIVPVYNSVFGQNISWKPKALYLDYHSHSEDRIDISLFDMHNQPLGGNTGLNNKALYIKLNFLSNSLNDERLVNRYDSRVY